MRKLLYNLVTDKYRGLIPSAIKLFLFALSLIYGLLVRILILFYGFFPYRLNCKVISVGNITLGGTGKTSLVEYIAKFLRSRGYKVAILSRGYGKKAKIISQAIGDEPYMLSEKLGNIPVIVDANRIKGAKYAIKEYGAQVVVLDDGFQQWRIKKDLEIVTINTTCPFGNKQLIPRGILREPLSSLRRADVFLLTKTNLAPDTQDLKNFLCRRNPAALLVESIHQPIGFYRLGNPDELLKPDILKGKAVTIFSGIGDPGSFENLIRDMGIGIGLCFRFPDHHNYSKQDLEKIFSESRKKNIDEIITTEKDAARLHPLSIIHYPLSIKVLRIELKIIKNEEGFARGLLGLFVV